MKIRKVISVILCVVLLCSLSMPAFASDSTLFPEDPVITEGNNAERIPGTTKAFVENVGNGVYYTEITDAYTLSVGIINGNADCAIKYNDKPNTIYSGVFNVDNGCASKGLRTKALEYRDAMLSDELTLQATVFTTGSQGLRSDADLIMSALYSAGWPTSYVNYLRETRYQGGATGNLYHSVTYSYSSYVNWFAIATTTLAAVITLTNLPAATLLAVASFAVTGAGIYVLIKDVLITRYNVFAYGTKTMYVQDAYQYYAGRTVKWLATVGDIGASLDFQYNNQHSDYNDHDSLFATAFYNYFNL